MVNAMVAANSSDPVKYLPELKKTNYKGVTGMIAFDEKGDIKNGALTLMTYKGWCSHDHCRDSLIGRRAAFRRSGRAGRLA
ncbi:MAG: hypothetical protein R3E42_01765 [Burkholderiaceae bacterium]